MGTCICSDTYKLNLCAFSEKRMYLPVCIKIMVVTRLVINIFIIESVDSISRDGPDMPYM